MASLTTVARTAAPIRVASRASSEEKSARAPAVGSNVPVATPPAVVRMPPAARRGERLVANGRKGMLGQTLDGEEGGGKKRREAKKAEKFAQQQSMAASIDPAAAKRKDGWLAVGNVNTDFKEKNIKLLELANGQFLAVRWEETGQVFVVPCASTAYQYPMIDGELFFGPMGPAIRVPLDGTEYDLTTGAVITWCPGGGNPVKAMLGALKKAADPIPLKSYPTAVESDGTIVCTFTQTNAAGEGFANRTVTPDAQ